MISIGSSIILVTLECLYESCSALPRESCAPRIPLIRKLMICNFPKVRRDMNLNDRDVNDEYSDIDFVTLVLNAKRRGSNCRECLSLMKSTETMAPSLGKMSLAEEVPLHNAAKSDNKEHMPSLAHVYFIHHHNLLELL